jgi:hypothetical protein
MPSCSPSVPFLTPTLLSACRRTQRRSQHHRFAGRPTATHPRVPRGDSDLPVQEEIPLSSTKKSRQHLRLRQFLTPTLLSVCRRTQRRSQHHRFAGRPTATHGCLRSDTHGLLCRPRPARPTIRFIGWTRVGNGRLGALNTPTLLSVCRRTQRRSQHHRFAGRPTATHGCLR